MQQKKTLGCNHIGYQIIQGIGQGAQGEVYLVQQLNPSTLSIKKQIYAMKIIPKSNKKNTEIKLLLQLNHPNIIDTYNIIEDNNYIYILFEYAHNGDLKSYCENNYKYIPQNTIINWLCQLTLGIYYLHENNLIHRDIKLTNIMVMKNGLLKLADFGIARKLNHSEDFAKTQVGTPYYLPPQAIIASRWDRKSDIWGLGCAIYQLCVGSKPFTGNSIGELIKSITNDITNPIPQQYSKKLQQTINEMLQKESQKRPTIQKILQKKEIQQKYKQLQKQYKQYEQLQYPSIKLKTTKNNNIQKQKTFITLQSFTQSLKTTKYDRSGKQYKYQNQYKQQKNNQSINNNLLFKQSNKNQLQIDKNNHILYWKYDNKYQCLHKVIEDKIKITNGISLQRKKIKNDQQINKQIINPKNIKQQFLLQSKNNNKKLNKSAIERVKFADKSLKSIIERKKEYRESKEQQRKAVKKNRESTNKSLNEYSQKYNISPETHKNTHKKVYMGI